MASTNSNANGKLTIVTACYGIVVLLAIHGKICQAYIRTAILGCTALLQVGKYTVCLALGGLFVTAGSVADAAPLKQVQLVCRVQHKELMQPGFEAAFCRELAAGLTDYLKLKVGRGWSRPGIGVVVTAQPLSRNAASITISFGAVKANGFVAKSTISRRLSSIDAGLQPQAARTLARDIGIGLGLIT